jgi:very-short-patch-repair endonuclease
MEYFTATDQRCEQSQVEQEIMARLRAVRVPIVPQVKLGNNWVFDGAVTGTRLIVEVHGDYWHTRPEVQARDARKAEWAAAEGYTIVTIWESAYQTDPEGEIARVIDAYEAALAWDAAAEHGAAGDKGNTPALPGSLYGDWRDRFLAVLSEGGIVREACIAAGVSRKTAYQHRKEQAGFAEDWKLALQDAADLALATYRRRALQQSDRAMEFFIKSRDPEGYAEPAGSLDVVLKYLDLSRLSNEQLDRIAAGDDPLQVLLGSGSPAPH